MGRKLCIRAETTEGVRGQSRMYLSPGVCEPALVGWVNVRGISSRKGRGFVVQLVTVWMRWWVSSPRHRTSELGFVPVKAPSAREARGVRPSASTMAHRTPCPCESKKASNVNPAKLATANSPATIRGPDSANCAGSRSAPNPTLMHVTYERDRSEHHRPEMATVSTTRE